MNETEQIEGASPGLRRVPQVVSVLNADAVVGLLLIRPHRGLYVTWFVRMPLVSALLLVAPRVWRNPCPIAVVHQVPRLAGKGGGRHLAARARRWAPAAAGAGLFLIIPMRLTLFNEHGPALALLGLVLLWVLDAPRRTRRVAPSPSASAAS